MKPGFAARKAKSKAKKKARQKKQQKVEASKNKDVEMGEADNQSSDGGIDFEFHKDEEPTQHRSKVQLKRHLKVKVAKLKQARNKLTKLPGDKQERKALTANMKELLNERKALNTKKATSSKGASKAGAADNTMDE